MGFWDDHMRNRMCIQKKWILLSAFILIIISIVNLWNSRGLDRAFAIVAVAENLEEKGNFAGAIEKYEEAVRIDPRSAYFLILLGKAY